MQNPYYFEDQSGSTSIVEINHDPTTLLDYCLRFDVSAAFNDDIKVQSLAADLHVICNGRDWRVGSMEVRSRLPPYRVKDRRAHWSFRMPLSARQLQAIDDSRGADGDVQFKIEVTVAYEYVDASSDPGTTNSPVARAFPLLRVPQSDWVKRLRAMGAADVLTFSVQVPPDRPDIRAIIEHLRSAQDELHAGRRPREVAGFVRKAMEAFMIWQADKAQTESAGSNGFSHHQGKPVIDRLQLARRAVHVLVGAAPHENDIEYDVPSVRASVAMAIALLDAYIERDDH